MRTRCKAAVLAAVVGLAGLGASACSQVEMLKARMAFKDANAAYQAQDYRLAAEKYQEALKHKPDLAVAYFYLANSYDNLYRPTRKGEPENDRYIQLAIENYKKATEMLVDEPKLRTLAYEYLANAYSPEKLNDPSQAEPIVRKMIEMDPQEVTNYFVLAKIYEDAGNYEEAEATLLRARDAAPKSTDVYMRLAGFYNNQGEFDKTIDALRQRASVEPNNPEAYYTIATYFWDKTFRDHRLNDSQKREYVQQGLEAVDKALSIKSDYTEALVYKGLLLRLQANLEKNPARQAALIKEADALRDKANELRKKQTAGAGATE